MVSDGNLVVSDENLVVWKPCGENLVVSYKNPVASDENLVFSDEQLLISDENLVVRGSFLWKFYENPRVSNETEGGGSSKGNLIS